MMKNKTCCLFPCYCLYPTIILIKQYVMILFNQNKSGSLFLKSSSMIDALVCTSSSDSSSDPEVETVMVSLSESSAFNCSNHSSLVGDLINLSRDYPACNSQLMGSLQITILSMKRSIMCSVIPQLPSQSCHLHYIAQWP